MENVRIVSVMVLMTMMIPLSCVKDPQDIPSGIVDNPVFGLRGEVDGHSITIEAGTDGWTMLPVVVVSDTLTQYKAVLSKDGCLDRCPSTWEFIIYQPLHVTGQGAQAFSQTLYEGEREYVPAESERSSYQISLSSHPGLFTSGLTYWENLNDSSTNYTHDYQSLVGYQDDMYCCLQAYEYTGCHYSQCLFFDPVTDVPCLAYIEPVLENPRFLVLHVRPEGTAPFSFLWANGSTSSTMVVPLQDTIATVYANVTVSDVNGNRSELNQTIKVRNGILDACYFPVSLSSELVLDASPAVFAGRVEIRYTDPEGQTWISSGGLQPDAPEWIIEDVEGYGAAPTTQSAYRVEANAKVRLYNTETGAFMIVNTDRLSLAFGHD